MAQGPGKYDDALTLAREACGATTAILIVIDGRLGGGFSMHSEPQFLHALPALLDKLAADIRADLAKLGAAPCH